jgi:hypothetical protein
MSGGSPAPEADGQEDASLPAEISELIESKPEVKRALEEGDPKALLSIFASLSRTTIGPDADTAKVLAEVEKHAEESRLKGYKATLAQQNEEQARNHEFRKKKLNHATVVTAAIVAVAIAGVITGVYLQITKPDSQTGGLVLVASGMALIQVLNSRGAGPG